MVSFFLNIEQQTGPAHRVAIFRSLSIVLIIFTVIPLFSVPVAASNVVQPQSLDTVPKKLTLALADLGSFSAQ